MDDTGKATENILTVGFACYDLPHLVTLTIFGNLLPIFLLFSGREPRASRARVPGLSLTAHLRHHLTPFYDSFYQ